MKRVLPLLLLILAATLCLPACKSKNKTVYHTVRFDVSYLSAETTAPEPVTQEEGSFVLLPALSVEATPGTVIIWTADLLSKAAYDPASPLTEDLTLYAVEVAKSYQITYLLDRGRNAASNPTSYDGTKEIVLAKPKAEGFFHFAKWTNALDPTHTEMTSIPVGTKGDLALRAWFLPNEYPILYDGLTEAEKTRFACPDTYVYGESVTLPIPERDGYDFLGYTAYADPSLEITEITSTLLDNEKSRLFSGIINIRLVANWREKE
ncbi:MAG: InlB B-repeat-containing protein [Clostridia bacterium]|nr:InlB B-repeat-containing protein [Clostridia bacterium]